MIPKVEIEASLEDQQMASVARVMSKGLRKLNLFNKNNAVLIFINQLRENPGAGMYGCIHGDTSIHLKDGRKVKIKEVVEKKLNGEVLTLNEKTGIFEYKKIIDWFKNGTTENKVDYIHIQTEGLGTKNGVIGFTITPTHKVLTKRGWIEAKQISLDDYLISPYMSMQGEMKEILYAIASGDSFIHIRANNTASLLLNDSNNPAYLKWKVNKLSPAFAFHKNSNGILTEYTHDLKLLKDEVGSFQVASLRNPLPFLERHFSRLGLALWIMDDGHYDKRGSYILSIKRLKKHRGVLGISSYLLGKLGYKNSIQKDGSLRFNKSVSYKIATHICHFVPKCMEYKLPENLRNKYREFDLNYNFKLLPTYVKIISIRNASDRQMRMRGKYDLEVEGNRNYMVGNYANGIFVQSASSVFSGLNDRLRFIKP